MKAYWVYANIDGRARWHLVAERGDEMYFVFADFAEEMTADEFQEEFPHYKLYGPIPGPWSCTCDDAGDDPCPVHARENALQDRAIKAENTIAELVGWTHEYGKALCPSLGSTDTYGEGIRAAKRQVMNIINREK